LGIIESQMLGLAKFYSNEYAVTIAVHESINLFKINKNNKYFTYKNRFNLLPLLKNADVIYFRNIYDYLFSFLYCRIKNKNTIYDFRGLVSYENFNENKNYLKFFVLYIFEFLAYAFSDIIQCVSEKMKVELKKMYVINKKINVVPCMVHANIKRTDSCEKGIKFVYIGNLSSWQMVDTILNLALQIQNEIDSIFTFITFNKSELEEKIQKTDLLHYKVLTGNNKFVQNSLSIQDFGFLIRDDLMLNRVSSPVKFLEYVSNGVIPIITPYIGDYSDDVSERKLGIIFNGDIAKLIKEIKLIIPDIKKYRQRLYSYSSSLTWDKFN
jgi:glycosyltransferase involved in cell wall biosynthesis